MVACNRPLKYAQSQDIPCQVLRAVCSAQISLVFIKAKRAGILILDVSTVYTQRTIKATAVLDA